MADDTATTSSGRNARPDRSPADRRVGPAALRAGSVLLAVLTAIALAGQAGGVAVAALTIAAGRWLWRRWPHMPSVEAARWADEHDATWAAGDPHQLGQFVPWLADGVVTDTIEVAVPGATGTTVTAVLFRWREHHDASQIGARFTGAMLACSPHVPPFALRPDRGPGRDDANSPAGLQHVWETSDVLPFNTHGRDPISLQPLLSDRFTSLASARLRACRVDVTSRVVLLAVPLTSDAEALRGEVDLRDRLDWLVDAGPRLSRTLGSLFTG